MMASRYRSGSVLVIIRSWGVAFVEAIAYTFARSQGGLRPGEEQKKS